MKPITEYLNSNYRPVYNTNVTAESFIQVAEGKWRTQALNPESQVVEYTLTAVNSGPQATCDIDGDRQTFDDPYTRVLNQPTAAIQQWFDWICRRDANGRNENHRTFEGDSIEAMLNRSTHNVVEYDTSEAAVRSFENTAQLQDWLAKRLQLTQVDVQVHAIGALPKHPLMLESGDSDGYRYWHAWAIDATLDPETWMQGPGDTDWRPEPSVSLSLSGAQVLSYNFQSVVPWQDFAESVELTTESTVSDPWWAIHERVSEVAICFPPRLSNILVDLDSDNSKVTISVRETDTRFEYHLARDLFEREWGKWLDNSTNLTDRELMDGIAFAERKLSQSLERG